jgi:ligand-binding sensor domain-containing protein
MQWKMVALGAAAIAVAAGAFELGRQQQGEPQPQAPVTSAAPVATAPAKPTPAAPPVPATPAAATAPLRDFDHFRVGNRNVKSMVADGDTLWVGTSGGVIRYNMISDSHVVYDNKSGLLSNGVFHVQRHKNELWVGTYGGGLSVLDLASGKWREYNVPEGLGDAFVYDVLHTKSGDTWIATWSGANRIRGGKMDDVSAWDLYTVENTQGGLPNDWVYGLAEGQNGDVWMATEGGVALFRDGKWTRWTHAEGLGASYDAVKDQIDLNNDPGQASRHHAQQKVEQGIGEVSVAYNPNYVISIAVNDDGSVWAGTWGAGLSRWDGQKWTTLTVKDGLPSNHVFMLEKGPKGELWIGTNRGLTKYDGKTFTNYTSRDGLVGDNVFSMSFADSGEMWVGSFGGITRFRKGL